MASLRQPEPLIDSVIEPTRIRHGSLDSLVLHTDYAAYPSQTWAGSAFQWRPAARGADRRRHDDEADTLQAEILAESGEWRRFG